MIKDLGGSCGKHQKGLVRGRNWPTENLGAGGRKKLMLLSPQQPSGAPGLLPQSTYPSGGRDHPEQNPELEVSSHCLGVPSPPVPPVQDVPRMSITVQAKDDCWGDDSFSSLTLSSHGAGPVLRTVC